MNIDAVLSDRSGSQCELCGAKENLTVYPVPPVSDVIAEKCVLLCDTCRNQIEGVSDNDPNHWRCLNDSIWSPVPAVQVVAWRMLDRLKGEGWPQDLLETVYLEDDVKSWAESGVADQPADDDKPVPTVDSNGTILNNGDSVTLIKDLVVKGGGFTAKRGTLVKNISLTSNPKHIEGRVNGTVIVLVAAYLKKASGA
jgi:protein PhnA